MDLKDLIPDPANRRKHTPRNLSMVADALREVGAARSIVIDENNVIMAGNGVSAAAGEAGITRVKVVEAAGDELVAVRRVGLTDEQKRALALYDNRTGELAEWDWAQLATDKAAGLPLKPWWTASEAAAWLPPDTGLTDADSVPAEPASTSIQPGDLFQLGAHRLLCGDATAEADVTRLMQGERATLFATDPPYAVGYEGGSHPKTRGNRASVPIDLHTDLNEICYEPFSGSGTQIIAAEQRGRRCFALELSPTFCQVTIDRWEAFTGQTAVKVAEAVRA